MKGVGGRGLIGDDAGSSTSTGPSSGRPILASGQTAFYLDTTLGRMIYWGGAHWFDMSGAQVADYVPTPVAPTGFVYLTDPDGSFLTDPDGAYLMEAA